MCDVKLSTTELLLLRVKGELVTWLEQHLKCCADCREADRKIREAHKEGRLLEGFDYEWRQELLRTGHA